MYGESGYMNMFHGGGILFWFFLVVVILILSINFFKKSDSNTSVLDILKKRYAKGEISKTEFEEMKKTIE